MKPHLWIVTAGVFGALGIGIGAFGAHGLPTSLGERGFDEAEIAKRLETFETGARYHMYAAIALLGIGLGGVAAPCKRWTLAGILMLAGSIFFSGLLYAIAVGPSEWKWLGMVVPIGGLLQIAAWVAIAAAGAAASCTRTSE